MSRRPGGRFNRGRVSISGGAIAPSVVLLSWADAQFNRQQDASVSPTYRTSSATFALATADTTRLENTGDGSGSLLLCEGRRACINIQSRAVNSWTNDNSATSAPDTTAAPDGATVADSVTFAATTISGKSKTQTGTNVTSSVNLAWQCWAKSGTGGDEKFKFRLNDKSAAVQNSIDLTVNQNWQNYTWDINSGAGAGNPVFRILNASDAVARGAGRVVIYDAVCVEEGAYPTSVILNESAGQNGKRYEDLAIFAAAQVPQALREGKWSTTVRCDWASANLSSGDIKTLFSFGDSSNVLRFRHTGTDVRLEAVVSGSVVATSGAVSVSRYGALTLIIDCAAGVLTVNGVAGAAGAAIVWPGGVMLRVGGVLGSTGGEADCAIDAPKVAV